MLHSCSQKIYIANVLFQERSSHPFLWMARLANLCPRNRANFFQLFFNDAFSSPAPTYGTGRDFNISATDRDYGRSGPGLRRGEPRAAVAGAC